MAGLTETELAFLLGWESASPVSRLEKGRAPKLALVFALEMLFGMDTATLFPTLSAETEDELARRAYELRQRFATHPSKRNKAKIQLLDEALNRIIERVKQRKA